MTFVVAATGQLNFMSVADMLSIKNNKIAVILASTKRILFTTSNGFAQLHVKILYGTFFKNFITCCTFLIISSSVAAQGLIFYKPFIIIDCGKNYKLYSYDCFRAVRLTTKKAVQSGAYEDVLSVSNFLFLYSEKDHVFPVKLDEHWPDKEKKYFHFIKKKASRELLYFSDRSERYAVIYVKEYRDRPANNVMQINNWRSDLKKDKLNALFEGDPGFKEAFVSHFTLISLFLKIEFDSSFDLDSPALLDYISEFNKKIISIKEVSGIYSMVQSYDYYKGIFGLKPRQRNLKSADDWYEIQKIWELGGEFFSGFFDRERRTAFIAIQSLRSAQDLNGKIKQVLDKNCGEQNRCTIYTSEENF